VRRSSHNVRFLQLTSRMRGCPALFCQIHISQVFQSVFDGIDNISVGRMVMAETVVIQNRLVFCSLTYLPCDFMRFENNPGPLVLVIAMQRPKRRNNLFPLKSVSIYCCSKLGTYRSTSMVSSSDCLPVNMTWPNDG
jgi:hypothetical protein